MNQNERFDYLKKDYIKGFPGHCGIQVSHVCHGRFETELKVRKEHAQREGFVHAGVLATMADHTAGYAAYTLVKADITILTIELKINYFKPVVGNRVVCRSKVINHGRRIIVAESELFSCLETEEKMVSKATVTLMAIPSSDYAT